MRTCLYMGRCEHPLACIALGVADGAAWQRDWESGSYVELSQEVVKLQGVKIRGVKETTSQD